MSSTSYAEGTQKISNKNRSFMSDKIAATDAAPAAVNAQNQNPKLEEGALSGNPAYTRLFPGSGALGKHLNIPDDWGVKLGGVNMSDTNKLFTGGQKPGAVASNNAFILATSIDLDKAIGWKGGRFGASLLQVNGQNTNGYAGVVVGYNAIVGTAPFKRTELYTLYFYQELFKDRLGVRVGKILPTVDFNNVTKVHRFKDDAHYISSLSSLIYTSIFVNPTIMPNIGGYYDSAYGMTIHAAPTEDTWVNSGVYDGNKATGLPSGIHNLKVNDYVFAISEAGMTWVIGKDKNPGQFGIGVWHQSGKIDVQGLYGNLQQNGAEGTYIFGGQRLWTSDSDKIYLSDPVENEEGNEFKSKRVASITMFYQYGVNNAKTMLVRQFIGGGFTAFALIADRPDDSFGGGMSLSFLNQNRFRRASELTFQTYYQAALIPGALFLQPTLSYIPTPGQIPEHVYYQAKPGEGPNLPPTVAGTIRLTGVF